jgi:hypothetical protein
MSRAKRDRTMRSDEMADAEDIILSYHRAIRTRMRAAARELAEHDDQGEQEFSRELSSLGEDVVRYIQANEISLYPAVAPLIRYNEEVMAPMIFDIRAIDQKTNEAEGLALLTLGAPEDARRERMQTIQRLAAQLEGIVGLHLEKLEQLYLPLLREMPPERQQEILDRLATEYGPVPEWPEAVPVASTEASAM